jgi:hypothetical protein
MYFGVRIGKAVLADSGQFCSPSTMIYGPSVSFNKLKKSQLLQRFSYSFKSLGLDRVFELSGFIKLAELKRWWEIDS